MVSARGSGEKIDPSRVFNEALNEADWLTMIFSKDNLVGNDCVTCLEERAMEINMDLGLRDVAEFGEMSFLPLNCCAHSCVLANKPLIQAEKVDGPLQKMANILDNGKRHNDLEQKMRRLIAADFEYIPVAEYPPDVVENMAEARYILLLTRAARDLTEADERLIVVADTGSWKSHIVKHHCLPNCPLECNGSKEKSLTQVTAVIILSVGGTCVKAVLARWKNVERALAFGLRGRRQHDLLGRSFQECYTKAVVDRALKDLAKAVDAAEEDFGARANVRGGDVCTFFLSDPEGKRLEKVLVICGPLQKILNKTFKAEHLVDHYKKLLIQDLETSDELLEAENAAVNANWEIISGNI